MSGGRDGAAGSRRGGVLLPYVALQGTSLGAVGAGYSVLWLLERLAGGGAFRTSWLAAFVVVPLAFAPVLWAWHAWAERRFGVHPRRWRLLAEAAFAVDVVGVLLARGIA